MAALDVTNLLDPEMRGAFEGFTVPPLDPGVLTTLRSFAFPPSALSDAVTRSEHEVPADPPVPVRLHRAAGAEGPQPAVVTIHGGGYVIGSYDMDVTTARPLVRGARGDGRVRRVPLGARDPLPGTARGLLCRAALDVRARRGARHRPQRGSASTG